MKTLIMILITMVLSTGALYGQTEDPPSVPSEEQPEVLTRGPVNEAFAQPVNIEEDNDFTAPETPPPDVEETPPEDRPEGDRFAWIPGYWAWDSDRNEYIWVSGCWRAVPPGKYWVPGYWTEVEDGWRWVAGYWAPVSNEKIEYLPPPPSVTYVPPPVTAAPDKIWVPACWYWHNGYYTLRSGYWIDAREDWVWVPSHYIWTPHGYVFVKGHWDYPFQYRGILFAPVYFPGYIHSRVRLSYSHSIVVDIGSLEFGLFTRPRYRHYYFGDYYDSFYIGIGIYPWFECVTRHTWYDPIYLHNRWHHRKHDRHWRQHERHEYARRRAHKNLRPPRTYREMDRRVRNMTESRRRNFEVAVPMKRHIEKTRTTFKFRKEKPETRKQRDRYANNDNRHISGRNQYKYHETDRRQHRRTLKSVRSTERNEKRTTVERKRPERKQSGYREYANIKHKDAGERRVRDEGNKKKVRKAQKLGR
ncbi:MAG: hypothetical protein PVG39_18560 [Desulfobacteraceae bacterium]